MGSFSFQGDLSGQTDGKPIKITQTASAGNTIHTAVSGTSNWDLVYIYAYNCHTGDVVLSIEYGDTDTITQTLTAGVGYVSIVPEGIPLQNSQVLKMFADNANVVYVLGKYHRHSG